MGADIDGEASDDNSGFSVALSADGTVVAIGAVGNDGSGNLLSNSGHVRVYKYDANKLTDVSNQSLSNFGPRGWNRLGADIDGEASDDNSGFSVALSADGTVVAIGAVGNDGSGNLLSNSGHVRVYKYDANKLTDVSNQSLSNFGPRGWNRLGGDIDGEAIGDQSGISVALSADGTVVAIGAMFNDDAGTSAGHVRVYKYDANKLTDVSNQSLSNFGPRGWNRVGADIDGEAAFDESGRNVALSADGTVVAIGAINNDAAGNNAGHVRVYKIDTFDAITYTSSNPEVAEIYGNALLLIKDISAGTTTITATQQAVPPFTMTPAIAQGTLTVTGTTTFSLVYSTLYSIFTPFPSAVVGDMITVAYGRAGTQGTGAPMWMVGGAGGTNVFARSSRPSVISENTWTVDASNAANAPFPICNSLGYSNGVWVAGNNTNATNILARSTNGGTTWTPVTASSISGIIAGSAAVGANAFCNYTLAYADYSNDTNLRSWIAIQGTKNFMFDGGVSAVATVTPNISDSLYSGTGGAWWVAGGRNQSNASIAYTTVPSGTSGWTLGTSTVANGGNGIADVAQINAVAFSPHTQNWVAVGVGSSATRTRTALYSANGLTWTSAVVSSTDASLSLNTCAWNQLDASASSAGRWLAGGTRTGVDASAVSLYISTDVSGQSWSPIVGTGAILSQVYSLAFNGSVWIAAGEPAISNGSNSTLMRTTDPTGAAGWQGIASTGVNTGIGGFNVAARSITWNAEQLMWIATGENTGSSSDASFSSMIYSRDPTGVAGTWRTVRESNSFCFSGEGLGVTFKGDRWFASGQGTNQIIATTGANAANAAAATWTPIAHGTALTSISDIAYTGRRLIAAGSSTGGSSNGVIYTTDNSGSVWTAAAATPGPGFTDALGGGTSIAFEPSIEGGAGRVVATGRSATNALSISVDGGVSWSSPSVQFSTSVLYANYNQITSRTQTVGFPVLNSLPNWIIDVSFTKTGGDSTWRFILGSMYNNVNTNYGWGIYIGPGQQIVLYDTVTSYSSFTNDISTNITYNLNVSKVGTSVTLRLTNMTTMAILTDTKTVSNPLGLGPVEIGGNGFTGGNTGEPFIGTIGYVVVSDHLKSSPSATTQPLFTTGGNSVAYVGNDTLFAGGADDVQWTGKRWVATGRNKIPSATTPITSTPLINVINNNTSAVATSDDGITWQSVSSAQAPNISEGTVVASNPRIGPTPRINSQIIISDGCDTESNTDYGGMTCNMGGSGSGVAQIDIIAELPPEPNAASSGAANILGAAGNAPTASFDNASFSITTRPI